MNPPERYTHRYAHLNQSLFICIFLYRIFPFIDLEQETVEQLKEFEASLEKMSAGNMSLVDSIGSVQLAIQAAIRSTTSPEILNMFLKKENGALRTKLAGLDSDRILGRITQDSYDSQAIDIVRMLEKLGESLNDKEQELLRKVNYSKPFFMRKHSSVMT